MQHLDNNSKLQPQIDLRTVRETLTYIRDDLAAVGELKHVAIAMQEAISQIEVAEARAQLPGLQFFRNARYLNRGY